MAINDFKTFATSSTANVYTNAEYVADTDQLNGNQPGVAKSKLVNKAIRQSSIISSVVAQYIADKTGIDSVDDGTTTALLSDLKTATDVAYNTHGATAKTTIVDTDEFALADSASSFSLKKLSFASLKTALASLFAPLASPALTGAPTAPTPTAGDNSTNIATTAFAMGAGIGSNQTWQDVTASRSPSTTYTNTTGKPIMLVIYGGSSYSCNNNALTVYVDGVLMLGFTPYCRGSATIIVPNGSNYYLTIDANAVLTKWLELR